MLGDSVEFSAIKRLEYKVSRLISGDVVQVVTRQGSFPLVKAEMDGEMCGKYTLEAPGFAFIEVLRSFLPGLPLLPATISNPIYFEG